MVDHLGATNPLKDVRFFGVQMRRNNGRNRLTNDLVRLEAEEPLGTGIPIRDYPFEIFGR